jgi:hypothetical protein
MPSLSTIQLSSMPASPSEPVIICADAIRALYPKCWWDLSIKAVCICGPFFILAGLFNIGWLAVIGILLCGGLLVFPLTLRVTRFITSLPCAACGQPAGRYTTVNLILHLQCNHCGHLSRTDCLMLGQPPTKI